MEPREEFARLCQEGVIVFIGCGKKKTWYPTKVKYLYQGRYFRLCLAVARLLAPDDRIFILSAKYGVLPLDREVKPYNTKLTKLTAVERKAWFQKVQRQMDRVVNGRKRIFICSRQYTKGLDGEHILPQLGIGLQMQWMERLLRSGR